MRSRVINLISYEGPEWSVPVLAMTDSQKAKKRAEDLNKKLQAGQLDEDERYFSPKLSRFVVTLVNLLEG